MSVKNCFFSRIIRTLNSRSGKYLCKRVHIRQAIFLSRYQFYCITCVFSNSDDIFLIFLLTRGNVSEIYSLLNVLTVGRDISKIDATNRYFFIHWACWLSKDFAARIWRSISFAKSGLFLLPLFYAGYENQEISRKRAYVEQYIYFVFDL